MMILKRCIHRGFCLESDALHACKHVVERKKKPEPILLAKKDRRLRIKQEIQMSPAKQCAFVRPAFWLRREMLVVIAD